MPKVLIPTKLDKAAAQLLKDRGYEVVQDAATPLAELCKANSDAAAMIVRSEAVTPEIIDLLPKLKLIVRAGAGFNTIDIKYARKKEIDVMNTPGANSNAVAEEVIALMLATGRHIVEADISTRAGKWEKSKFMGREITGKTVGILGLGHIGQLLIQRLSGFEVKILGYDPMLSPERAESLGVELVPVEKIFAEADFVTLHIPENNETRGMINAKLFSLMKDGATLINCARYGILNEADLRAAKAGKKIIFCNDVYPKDIEGDKSVKDIADIMMPHLGASTVEANLTAAMRSAEQTIAYFEQGITNFVVNKSLPDGLNPKFQKLAFVLTKIANSYLGELQPSLIETSFYGDLAQFGKWMLSPIAAGIAEDFAPDTPAADAQTFLTNRGVELRNREVDNDKRYGDAMTIDLFAGNPRIKASVRGTITENNLMVSRINNYEHLYLEPTGNHLFVEYSDAPGIMAQITALIAEAGINISDIRAPQDLKNGTALAVVSTNRPVEAALVEAIRKAVKAKVAFGFSF